MTEQIYTLPPGGEAAMTWTLPDISTLPAPSPSTAPVKDLAEQLKRTLRDLEAPADIMRTLVGPSTIGFELAPRMGTRMRDFTRLGRADDIAYALGSETVRIQAPIPGKRVVGIEIPSPARRVVALSEVAGYSAAPLAAGVGVRPDGSPLVIDIAALPHLAVAGASGSGKSSLLHALICSLLMKSTPDDLQLLLIDPKRVEFPQYAGLPHLPVPVVSEIPAAVELLETLVDEVENRYRVLEAAGARDITEYNLGRAEDRLASCLCVVDELADLMIRSRHRVEEAVTRIGQLGRACGVHLILATQSPHREILSGLIKANMPARVALRVASGVHSRVAIDQTGAETLLGRGDALLQDGKSVGLVRFQSAYVPAQTVREIVRHWTGQTRAEQDRRDPHRLVVDPPKVPVPDVLARPAVRFIPASAPARQMVVAR